MRILIVAIHYSICSGRYAFDALRRLGHDVRSMGPFTDHIWGRRVPAENLWHPLPPEDGWTPELVIIMDSGLALDRRLGDMPHVVYGVDNHVRDYAQFNGIADHFFLAHGHGARIGEPNVSWLPCAYDPRWFRPGPPWRERGADTVMIGAMYEGRVELLDRLRARLPGLSLRAGPGITLWEYAAIYQYSCISLIRSAAGDVAQRVWETAATGCLLLMDECHDAAALGLVHGENCLMYRTLDEAADLVQRALDHRAEAEQIAQVGRAWAAPGTWDARLREIVRWAGGE